MARQRNRNAPMGEDGVFLEVWFTVETEEGNAVGGVDAVFDFESEEDALRVVQNLAVDVGKPLKVVGYTRSLLGTYAAVTSVEKID